MARTLLLFAQWLIARRRTWLRLLSWITRFGYWLFILYGLVEWFRPRPLTEQIKRRKTLVYCLFSVILGSSLSWCIGKLWHRPRPFVQGDAQALVPHKANASFPSNHSMNSLAISLMLLARGNRWGLPALAWTGVLAASRVLSGLHYVSDVLGGFCIGAAASHVVYHSKRCSHLADQVLYDWHVVNFLVRELWRKI